MKEKIEQLVPNIDKLREAEETIERLNQEAQLNEEKCLKNHIPKYGKENVLANKET